MSGFLQVQPVHLPIRYQPQVFTGARLVVSESDHDFSHRFPNAFVGRRKVSTERWLPSIEIKMLQIVNQGLQEVD